MQRQLHRLDERQLPSRVLPHRSAEVVAVDRPEAQAEFLRPETRRDPRGAGADDQQVEVVPGGGVGREPTGHGVGGSPALVDRVSDQCDPAEFSGDVEPGNARLEVVGEDR